ncbi:MAG: hypothetical protein OXU73_01070 [Candidatus Campbellbacteria bacterium]|nr:hypothetical protein [Candidatus Campbellbacteria bacterium]
MTNQQRAVALSDLKGLLGFGISEDQKKMVRGIIGVICQKGSFKGGMKKLRETVYNLKRGAGMIHFMSIAAKWHPELQLPTQQPTHQSWMSRLWSNFRNWLSSFLPRKQMVHKT